MDKTSMTRPQFDAIKSYAEFQQYYWYLAELKAICQSLGLEYVGGKIELNHVIKAYFDGVKIPHRPQKTVKSKVDNLTLTTGLIECGFTFGERFRDFYRQVTGEQNFKFTADMVATAKAVKQRQDVNFTLGDLLAIKTGEKVYATYDKSSCQWNQFLQDFCADANNAVYTDKLKVASHFWRLLRDSPLPKVYSREFIAQNKNKLTGGESGCGDNFAH